MIGKLIDLLIDGILYFILGVVFYMMYQENKWYRDYNKNQMSDLRLQSKKRNKDYKEIERIKDEKTS